MKVLLDSQNAVLARLREVPPAPNGLSRVCLHEGDDAMLHVMAILSRRVLSFPRHYHPVDEFMFVAEGAVELLFDDDSKSLLLTSSMVIIPAGVAHSVSFLEPMTAVYEVKQGPFIRGVSTVIAS